MGRIPAVQRYDLSSLGCAVHAAAPCPIEEHTIDWWGPIIDANYGATEGLGFSDSAEWLAHKGTVGRVCSASCTCSTRTRRNAHRQTRTAVVRNGDAIEYFNDPVRTAEGRAPNGTMSTMGDVGYVDADGFVYLTGRATFMIVSGSSQGV
jgi:long-chain acyl-CoA synthetase